MAAGIIELLNDTEQRERLGATGKMNVHEKFNDATVAAATLESVRKSIPKWKGNKLCLKTWLIFVFMTVSSWGLYGVFLHQGQVAMGDLKVDPNVRYKAFLFVGIAYLLAAVIGSALMLVINGSNWQFTGSGVSWSFVAGLVGAIGAFGVLLRLWRRG